MGLVQREYLKVDGLGFTQLWGFHFSQTPFLVSAIQTYKNNKNSKTFIMELIREWLTLIICYTVGFFLNNSETKNSLEALMPVLTDHKHGKTWFLFKFSVKCSGLGSLTFCCFAIPPGIDIHNNSGVCMNELCTHLLSCKGNYIFRCTHMPQKDISTLI